MVEHFDSSLSYTYLGVYQKWIDVLKKANGINNNKKKNIHDSAISWNFYITQTKTEKRDEKERKKKY